DLYVGPPGQVRYHNTTKYDHTRTEYQVELYNQPEPGMRPFTLYFPLYQGVRQVWVGLDSGAAVQPPEPWGLSAPVVAYGTSITQGGCAARPGMAYTNLLSRALDAEVINLGFSGSGQGEPEVARVLAGIAPCALFVLDYEANSQGTERYRQTLPEFVRILREAQAETPILVVSRIRYASELVSASARRDREERLALARDLVEARRAAGDRHLHFCDGSGLLGDEDWEESTVDGVHPTDLGFHRLALHLEPVIREVLGLSRSSVR
ncbi:MAG: SGNH/GDSL hydrolase family protein, partial [Gemmatimonadota bacterium]